MNHFEVVGEADTLAELKEVLFEALQEDTVGSEDDYAVYELSFPRKPTSFHPSIEVKWNPIKRDG